MNEKKIYIVTGKIQTGKTTGLFSFASNNKSVDGILAPIVDGQRRLYHISSKTLKNFEVKEHNNSTVSVGKYLFLSESFNWANSKILESFNNSPDWLIIDEIGKLELKGEGLHRSVESVIKKVDTSTTKIILVIRDYLLNEALELYGISDSDYEILIL